MDASGLPRVRSAPAHANNYDPRIRVSRVRFPTGTLYWHEPASTYLVGRASRTRGARGSRARMGHWHAPVLRTAVFVAVIAEFVPWSRAREGLRPDLSGLTRLLERPSASRPSPILVLTNRTSKGCSGIRCRIPGGRAAILVVEDQRLDLPDALRKLLARSFVVALFTILPTLASAQAHDATSGHADPVTPVVLALAVILTAAKFGGHLAVRMGQPAVLGELVAGVALGRRLSGQGVLLVTALCSASSWLILPRSLGWLRS
jgi:hypothetical protein